MKQLPLIFVFFLSLSMYGQGLNETAQIFKNGDFIDLKDGGIELYGTIREYSTNKWKDDHQMVIYEINQQADSALEFIKALSAENNDIPLLMKSIKKWSKGDMTKEFFHPSIDWSIVMYEYKNQLEAKKAY